MGRRATSIADEPRVVRALTARGWRGRSEPEQWLRLHVRRAVERWLVDAHRAGIEVGSLSDVPRIAANHLHVHVIEAETDEDLDRHVSHYCDRGELSFKLVRGELDGSIEGAIMRLRSPSPGERPFVALIDARGERSASRYFCSCHEIGHVFLEPQMEMHFRCRSDAPEPLERTVDIIAGEVAFHEPLARPLLHSQVTNDLSYDASERFWIEHAPFSSRTAAFRAVLRLWPEPALLVLAEMRRAKHGRDLGVPALRVSACISNDAARAAQLYIPPYRVPDGSAIALAYADEAGCSFEQIENLGDWRTSDGSRLPSNSVRVGARRVGDVVFAVIRL